MVGARHPEPVRAGDALAEDDVVLHGVIGAATDVDAAARGPDGVADDLVEVGLERDDLGAFAVGMVEEVTLDDEVGPFRGLFVELARTPNADVLAAVTDIIRDVLKIASDDGVVLRVLEAVADERLEVVLPLEVAAVEGVVAAVEEDPVVGGLEAGRIIINDGGVAHDAVVGVEGDHGPVG